MKATFRPIDSWPNGEYTKPYLRKSRYTFKGNYSSTLELLEKELGQLGAREVVIQLELNESDIRLDGMPRTNATPKGPAVVVSFDSKHGPLRYATDTFSDWKSNLRAIALGLEALRKVERYGITKRGEQYTGWKQLGAGIEMPAAQMTVEEAARFLATVEGSNNVADRAGVLLSDAYELNYAYKLAAKRLHPDAGGSTEEFQKLQEAKLILDEALS
jgi:hypothetical protein